MTPAAERLPWISVVVPARNEERHLGRCLDSIVTQDYPPDRLEIVVVENGSGDGTAAVAESYARRDPRITVLVSKARNQAEAMNIGIRTARGEIVARVDAHSWLGPGYLRGVAAALARYPDTVGVGGPFLPAGATLLERVAAKARSSPVGVGGGYGSDRRATDHPVATVQCGAYRRQALLDIGLFDPAMAYGEDEELNWRFVRRGATIMLCPALAQYYRPRPTLRALARQYWNYGQGRFRVVRKHPDFLRPKHVVPSLFVAALPGLVVSAGVGGAVGITAGGVLAAYAALLAVEAVREAVRGSWREALLLPAAILAMHVGYGSGMIWAALRGLTGKDEAAAAATAGEECRA